MLRCEFTDVGQCVGRLKSRNDAFTTATDLKGFKRFGIGNGNVIHAFHFMKPGVFRPDTGVVKAGGDRVGIDNLPVVIL